MLTVKDLCNYVASKQ